MAAKRKPAASAPRKPRRKAVEARSRGLEATDVRKGEVPARVREVERRIEAKGGAVIGTYREPLGGNWQVLASLPIELVAPTPYQRDLSEAHAKRLTDVIGKLDRFLDPIIAVESDDGWWTPNGGHRLAAVRALGGKAIVALVVPEREVAHRILPLNTEKAHVLREKSLEVVRLARALAELGPGEESGYALEFEEAPYLTLGLCYERRGRFAGGAYHPVLKRVDSFLDRPLGESLALRGERADALIELDDAVAAAIEALKARGFQSPYLRAFVVARVNPIRFVRDAKADFDDTIGKMLASARKFDASKIKPDQVAAASGPPEE